MPCHSPRAGTSRATTLEDTMARSSLLGTEPAATEAPGRDKATLGPSDSSDSGSDVVGLDGDDDDADPGLPVDVALRDDQGAPLPLGESLPASEGGTGVRDGADIGVDRVFTPGQPEDTLDDETPATGLLDDAEVEADDEDAGEGVEGTGTAQGEAARQRRTGR